MNKLKKIKPLIIGIGLAGKRHLEAQLNFGNKTGVYTTNPQTAKELIENKNVIVFDSLEEGMEWANLVQVCTPDNSHTKFIKMALKKKKAVLSEKPLTTNLNEAITLQKLAHEYKTPLIVGHNYRLTPTFLEIKKRIEKGELGQIIKIETTYLHDMTQYRLENKERNRQDFLYVGGSHAVDLMLWIIGEKVVSAKSKTGVKTRSEYDSQEKYQIVLEFSSGILGKIKLDASSKRLLNGTDLIVEGKKGQLISHNKKDELWFIKNDSKKSQTTRYPNLETLTIPLEVKIVNDYLLGKTDSYPPLPNVDEAVYIIKILSMIQKSASKSLH